VNASRFRFQFVLGLVGLLLLATGSLSAQSEEFSLDESPLPPPTSPVMDYAGVMDEATRQRIVEKIESFESSSTPMVQMGVAIVKTTGDRPIFEYSLAVARGWGIGSREDDNPGLLLFVAIDDRKYFTQVSRDLEGVLPDGLVGSKQREFLVPQFKAGNYGKGIEDTIGAYIEMIQASQAGFPDVNQPGGDKPYEKDIVDRSIDAIPPSVCRFFCFLAVLLIVISVISANRRSGGGGGGGGGSGSGGDFLGAFLAGLATGSSGSSSSSWGSSDWGSSSDWSSGGSDWGGFGGGGDFGGGGSGGDW